MDLAKLIGQYGLPVSLLIGIGIFFYVNLWPLIVRVAEAHISNLNHLTDKTLEIQEDTQKLVVKNSELSIKNSEMHAKNLEMIERLLRDKGRMPPLKKKR